MAEQVEDRLDNAISFARLLSLPLFALILALFLIYIGPPTDLSMGGQIIAPDKLGGYRLHLGLRDIAIVFGLSCLPGGLIGAMLGYLIAQKSKLASASISLLRIGQWAPFLIWWVLVILLFEAPDQQRGRYFFDWTMGLPAVALGVCYHILCTRHLLRLGWRTSVVASAGLACHRALFISIVLALSVWSDNWVVVHADDNAVRHYVTVFVLGSLLLVINYLNKSGIDHSASLYRDIILADLSRGRESSIWTSTLIVVLFVAGWQMLSLLGYSRRVSPLSVFNATVTFFSGGTIWQDMWVSLREIFAGIVFSGPVVLLVSGTLLTNGSVRQWTFPILSLTFAIPMVILPAWHGSLVYQGRLTSYATSIACLLFFPLIHTVWALRKEPLFCRILLAADHALPFGFAATLYGQMMGSTAGLGFATIVASATVETEKAFALFLITLSVLFVLSTTLRSIAKWFLPAFVPDELTND